MFIGCRKPECKDQGEAVLIAKFYPGAWYVNDIKGLGKKVDEFFEKHRHEYDDSLLGGFQYELLWQEVGDGTSVLEVINTALTASPKDSLI